MARKSISSNKSGSKPGTTKKAGASVKGAKKAIASRSPVAAKKAVAAAKKSTKAVKGTKKSAPSKSVKTNKAKAKPVKTISAAKKSLPKMAIPKKAIPKKAVGKPKVPVRSSASAKPAAATKTVAKKLSGAAPKAASGPASKSIPIQDLTHFKTVLLEKRRRLFGDVAMMSEEALGSEDAAIDNHAPIHPAEVGSHSFEQEFTLGLVSRDGDKIKLIDIALEKIAEGSYGVCDECGARIPKGRLELLPESIFCVKCASKLETFSS
jgi:DnaK suppressor protein